MQSDETIPPDVRRVIKAYEHREQTPDGEPKHCPFCGFRHISVAIKRCELGQMASVTCDACGAKVFGFGAMDNKTPPDELVASALQAWNTRSEPRPDDEEPTHAD